MNNLDFLNTLTATTDISALNLSTADQPSPANDLNLWLQSDFTFQPQLFDFNQINLPTRQIQPSTLITNTPTTKPSRKKTADKPATNDEKALDKRQRNTLASAKFRANKKKRDQELKVENELLNEKVEELEKKLSGNSAKKMISFLLISC